MLIYCSQSDTLALRLIKEIKTVRKQEFKKAYSMARKGEQYNGFKSCFYQPLYNLGYSKSEVIELLYFKYAPAKDNFGYKALLANRLPVNKESRTFSLFGASIKIFNY